MEDCIIIGAGAAGLFAAGAAVHAGKRVTVLEHMDAPGKKLLITGKGRCNVTNNCGPDEFLKNVRRNPRFLYSALNACPPAFVMELLEKGLGVMDSTAAAMCRDNHIPVLVFSLSDPDNILAAVLGKNIGTIVKEDETDE